jgi:hypothetical protein
LQASGQNQTLNTPAHSLSSIRKKQSFPANLVSCDAGLPSRRDNPIDEALGFRGFDMRMLDRVDDHHAILVEQASIAFCQNGQIGAIFEVEPGGAGILR